MHMELRKRYSVALRAVGCCVLLCSRRAGARWVLRAVAGRLGPCSCASVLCCWSALVGRLSVLECAFWGFLLLLAVEERCAVTPIPTIASLCNIALELGKQPTQMEDQQKISAVPFET